MSYLYYTTNTLNRQAEKRSDAEWIKHILGTPDALIWIFWNSMPLVDEQALQAVSISKDLAKDFISQGATYVAAGDLESGGKETKPVLALDVSTILKGDPTPDSPAGKGAFVELRPFVSGFDPQVASILAYARSMFVWHQLYQFCGSCGSPTWPQEHGHSRKCESETCRKPLFPRLNPAVIMLVTAADQALLARNVNFPEGLHSVLAGYVEHGESLEQAVAREIKEEVGLDIDRVSYVSSQPWPYTNSLMLGYHAEIDGDILPKITIDEVEIESARWWSREQLRAERDNPHMRIPPRDAIARQLLDRWLLADL